MKLRELIGFLVVVLILAGGVNGWGAETTSGSEQEWERTVKAAEQEGQVVVYKIAHDSEWLAFQKRFPKIKVVLIQGNAAQIQQRLLAERRAGKFLADVVRLGGGTSTSLYKAKALDPIAPALLLPEVKDASKWLDGKHHYNDIDNQYVFVYAAFPLHLLGYQSKVRRSEIIDQLLGSPRSQMEGQNHAKRSERARRPKSAALHVLQPAARPGLS